MHLRVEFGITVKINMYLNLSSFGEHFSISSSLGVLVDFWTKFAWNDMQYQSIYFQNIISYIPSFFLFELTRRQEIITFWMYFGLKTHFCFEFSHKFSNCYRYMFRCHPKSTDRRYHLASVNDIVFNPLYV